MPIVKNNISRKLSGLSKRLKNNVTQDAYEYFKGITPIDTGNARRRTKLKGSTIHADYKYASALDKGHSSQAPSGMTKPLEKWLKKRVDRIIRKAK